jgi:hypothetical protein
MPSASRREGRALLAAGVVALLATLVVAFAALRQHAAARGPAGVAVTAASTTGGATYRACGREATAWCRTAAARHDALARAVARQCRRAGYQAAGASA